MAGACHEGEEKHQTVNSAPRTLRVSEFPVSEFTVSECRVSEFTASECRVSEFTASESQISQSQSPQSQTQSPRVPSPRVRVPSLRVPSPRVRVPEFPVPESEFPVPEFTVSESESQTQSSHSRNSEFAVSEVGVHRVHSLRFPGIKDRLHSSEFIVSEFTVSLSLAVTPDAWQGSPLMIGMVRNLKL